IVAQDFGQSLVLLILVCFRGRLMSLRGLIALRCLIEALAPTGVSHIPSAWYRFFYRLKEETCKIDFLGAMRVLVISWFVRAYNGSHRSWNMLAFRGRLMSHRELSLCGVSSRPWLPQECRIFHPLDLGFFID